MHAAVDPADFFLASRVHIVAGKGGVGKTTLTAALARLASSVGLSVLVVEIEGKGGLPALLGRPDLGYDDVEVVAASADGAGAIRARALTADAALVEYLEDHGLGRLAKRMVDTGVTEVVTRGAPGMKDILLLGKIKQLERAGVADVVLVDAPASGHAITFLRSPAGLLDAVRLGPINSQAAEVLELLRDGSRCQVDLVTLPEETPVNELVDVAYALEEEVGIKLGPILVNAVLPPLDLPADARRAASAAGVPSTSPWRDPALLAALDAAARFRRRRSEGQQEQLRRLGELLPLPQVRVDHRPGIGIGEADLEPLADDLRAGILALGSPPAAGAPAATVAR